MVCFQNPVKQIMSSTALHIMSTAEKVSYLRIPFINFTRCLYLQMKLKLRNEVMKYEPIRPWIDHVNILLVGAVGAGKSSTINSFASTIREKVYTLAYSVNSSSNTTVTKKVSFI